MDTRSGNQIKGMKQYEIRSKIGSGAFGDIHIGIDTRSNMQVAIKIEDAKSKSPQLQSESKLYRVFEGGYGIPHMYMYESDSMQNIMVMDLLGPSLEDLFNFCDRKFSEKTVYMLAIEMITRVEYIHDCYFIHRDIKPDNFVIGMGEGTANLIYIIDYGLSKRYFNPNTNHHISYRENRHLTGTPRYASLANHLGIEQSRRDDLESLGYVLLYFLLKGKLPWQGLNAYTKKQKYNKIMEYKIENNFYSICKDFPNELVNYFDYCRSLRFDDKPDYDYLRSLFQTCLKHIGAENDGIYDWMTDKVDTGNCLPKHCKTSDNRLLPIFKHPASFEMRTKKRKEIPKYPAVDTVPLVIPYVHSSSVEWNRKDEPGNPGVIPFNRYSELDYCKRPLSHMDYKLVYQTMNSKSNSEGTPMSGAMHLSNSQNDPMKNPVNNNMYMTNDKH